MVEKAIELIGTNRKARPKVWNARIRASVVKSTWGVMSHE